MTTISPSSSTADLWAAQQTSTQQTSTQQTSTQQSGTQGTGHRHHGGKGMKAAMDAAATELGLSPDDLQSDLQSGQSLTQLASQQGVSTDALTAAMSTALQGANSSLSSDQADGIATRMISGPSAAPSGPGGPWGAGGGDSSTAFGKALDAAAAELGTTTDALRDKMSQGQSLIDVASGSGVSADDLTSTLSSALQSADTSLSSTQANALADRLAQGPPPAGATSTGQGSSGGSGSTGSGWDSSAVSDAYDQLTGEYGLLAQYSGTIDTEG